MSSHEFLGRAPLTVDAKGRITVPARYRDLLQALGGGQVTLARHPRGQCLLLYPRPAWEVYLGKLMQLPVEAEGWRRMILSTAQEMELDGASRLLLAQDVRGWVGIDREAMLIGNGGRLEIWEPQRLADEEARVQASEMPDAIKGYVL